MYFRKKIPKVIFLSTPSFPLKLFSLFCKDIFIILMTNRGQKLIRAGRICHKTNVIPFVERFFLHFHIFFSHPNTKHENTLLSFPCHPHKVASGLCNSESNHAFERRLLCNPKTNYKFKK